MWYYNNIRIFIEEMPEKTGEVIARLQPLSGGTIHQSFGWESSILNFKGYIVGDTDYAALKVAARDGNYHSLTCSGVTIGNFYLHSLVISRTKAIWQSLRTDLDCTAPVYSVEGELYWNE
jgi:hypothetical protein